MSVIPFPWGTDEEPSSGFEKYEMLLALVKKHQASGSNVYSSGSRPLKNRAIIPRFICVYSLCKLRQIKNFFMLFLQKYDCVN